MNGLHKRSKSKEYKKEFSRKLSEVKIYLYSDDWNDILTYLYIKRSI